MNLSIMCCCGVAEIDGLQYRRYGVTTPFDPEKALRQLYNDGWSQWNDNGEQDDDGPPFLIFTAVVAAYGSDYALDLTNGDVLMKYIRDNRLGAVKRSQPKRNPNTDNEVRAYLWTVAPKNFNAWAQKRLDK